MDFTREPIIETVITPKEGCKLVVRSSKSAGQEEYFVDAVEVVSFGHSFFFRSLERPKTFFVPATDYEILEVREARMVLKNVGIDRTIKIAGGREAQMRSPREQAVEKEIVHVLDESEASQGTATSVEKPQEVRFDKKRDRRRNYRRRRGREGAASEEESSEGSEKPKLEMPEMGKASESEDTSLTQQVATTSVLTSLLPPPPMLISDTISRYKDDPLLRNVFFAKTDIAPSISKEESLSESPQEISGLGNFEMSEQEEEEIYKRRKQHTKSLEKHKKDQTPDSDVSDTLIEPPSQNESFP